MTTVNYSWYAKWYANAHQIVFFLAYQVWTMALKLEERMAWFVKSSEKVARK